MGPKIATKKTPKTIEETYKKVDQVDHILLRPDTYIGDVKIQNQSNTEVDKSLNELKLKTFDDQKSSLLKV